MEATLRPYDRGEEVTPFATLGLYHAYRALPSYAYPFVLSYLRCSEGRRGRSKNEFRKQRRNTAQLDFIAEKTDANVICY